ncbi:hypothetical protein FKM82_027253, partial [Ascaphus truei]
FKVSGSQKSPAFAGSSNRSANILDNMSKFSRKQPASGNPTASKSNSVIKPLAPKAKSKQGQATLFQTARAKPAVKKPEDKERDVQSSPSAAPANTENRK